jgi:hypothetical protein
MATSYPGSLDSLPRPSSSTTMDASGYEGDVVIDNLSDAVEAIETELGTDPAGAQATVKARLSNLSLTGPLRWGSGEWLGNGVASQTSSSAVTLAADTLYLVPVWIPDSATLDRIAINVTAGQTSATARLGVYASDGSTGLPTGTATDLGEVGASGTGIQSLTISQAVTGGQHLWVGLLNKTVSVGVAGRSPGCAPLWVGSAAGTSMLGVVSYSQAATYGSGFPTIGSLTAVNDVAPISVIVRRT